MDDALSAKTIRYSPAPIRTLSGKVQLLLVSESVQPPMSAALPEPLYSSIQSAGLPLLSSSDVLFCVQISVILTPEPSPAALTTAPGIEAAAIAAESSTPVIFCNFFIADLPLIGSL